MRRVNLLLYLITISLYTNAQWTPNGATTGNIYYNGGGVGIGTANPQGPLHVYGGNAVFWGITLGWGWPYANLSTDDASKALSFQIANTEYARLHYNGNFGIGTSNPTEKLEVSGSAFVNGESVGYIIDANGLKRIGLMKYQGREGGIWRTSNQDFEIGRVNVEALPGTPSSFQTDLYVGGNGSVGVGTTNVNDASYKLFVESGIRTRKVKVDQTTWADYVFAPTYKLPSLTEVEAFIKANKHLPEVPSAKEVEADGLDLGDNQAVLLKKIEELTLYIIEQDKEIQQLKSQSKELLDLKKDIESIKAKLQN